MKTKTLKMWKDSTLDLDEFLSAGDKISEDLARHIGECIAPTYCSADFTQGGDPIKSEDGVLFYTTVYRGNKDYIYLGVLPEFKQ
jgi:hypothetical protein